YNARYDAPANTWRYLANDFASAINFTSSGHILFRTAPSGTAGNSISYGDRMIIANNGNVGIDILAPLARLDVRKTVGHSAGTGSSSDGPTTAIITGGATARFNDWPNTWVGGLSTWDVCGASTFFSTYATRSDRSFKKDISLFEYEKLKPLFMQLKPVSYRFNEDVIQVDDNNRLRYGFIANEVENLFPDLVINAGMPQEVRRGLEYDGFIPLLVTMVQNLQKEVDNLKRQLEEKNRN
ncbi:MAG: tail fiber domain-containing protein, partial [Flavobacteriales bacterium]|nr:tail fiber domain-containing protein [Flavobacteriales bacterium]